MSSCEKLKAEGKKKKTKKKAAERQTETKPATVLKLTDR